MDRADVAKMLGTMMAIAWILFGMMLIIRLTAGDGGYLGAEMLRHTKPEYTGLPEAEYPGMGNMIAGYLTRRIPEFQYEFTDTSGRTVTCFHDYEGAHMADCRELIRMAEAAAVATGSLALFLLVMGFVAAKDRRSWFRGMILGIRIVLGAAAVLAIWAVSDFNGFFTAFHRIAFTNDGWLLNPWTDMLIRLMPTEFFISLGIRGAWLALIAPVVLEITARFGLKATKR